MDSGSMRRPNSTFSAFTGIQSNRCSSRTRSSAGMPVIDRNNASP